jgi:hypothetical protein
VSSDLKTAEIYNEDEEEVGYEGDDMDTEAGAVIDDDEEDGDVQIVHAYDEDDQYGCPRGAHRHDYTIIIGNLPPWRGGPSVGSPLSSI